MSTKLIFALVLAVMISIRGGSCFQCYVSECISTENNPCPHGEGPLKLEDCDIETARNSWRMLTRSNANFNEHSKVNCAKFEVIGKNYPHESKKDTIKMCLPVMDRVCETLQEQSPQVITDSAVPKLDLRWYCYFCNSDKCNSAARTTIFSAFIYLLLTITLRFYALL